MASSYKYFSDHDRVVANNNLTEVVAPEKGSGWTADRHAPNYFTKYGSGSVDYALCKKVFDVTFGRSSETTNDIVNDDFKPEQNIYNQFAKVLLGYNTDNTVNKFSLDENDPTKTLHNAYFINFDRTQFKDKIHDGTFKLTMNVSGAININLVDSGSSGTEIRECASGHYGKLYATASSTSDTSSLSIGSGEAVEGLVFYEAGVAVVSPYIFSQNSVNDNPSGSNEFIDTNTIGILLGTAPVLSGSYNIKDLVVSGSIANNCDAISGQLLTASFYSVTEMNSTIYFCRAYNHEFNYSTNPTYLSDSEIVVKNGDPSAQPRAYITTVGLYSDDNQLLAVAKLSEPILKTPENELIARVRLDW